MLGPPLLQVAASELRKTVGADLAAVRSVQRLGNDAVSSQDVRPGARRRGAASPVLGGAAGAGDARHPLLDLDAALHLPGLHGGRLTLLSWLWRLWLVETWSAGSTSEVLLGAGGPLRSQINAAKAVSLAREEAARSRAAGEPVTATADYTMRQWPPQDLLDEAAGRAAEAEEAEATAAKPRRRGVAVSAGGLLEEHILRQVAVGCRRLVLAADRRATLFERAIVRHAALSPRVRVLGVLGCFTELWDADAGGHTAAALAAAQAEHGPTGLDAAAAEGVAVIRRAAALGRAATGDEALIGVRGSLERALCLAGLPVRDCLGPAARLAGGGGVAEPTMAGEGGTAYGGHRADKRRVSSLELDASALSPAQSENATAGLCLRSLPPLCSQAALLSSFCGVLAALLDVDVDERPDASAAPHVLATCGLSSALALKLGTGVRARGATQLAPGAQPPAKAGSALPGHHHHSRARDDAAAAAAAGVSGAAGLAVGAASPSARAAAAEAEAAGVAAAAAAEANAAAMRQRRKESALGLLNLQTGVTGVTAWRLMRAAVRCVGANGGVAAWRAALSQASSPPDPAALAAVLAGSARPRNTQQPGEGGVTASRRRRSSIMAELRGGKRDAKRSGSATLMRSAVRRMSIVKSLGLKQGEREQGSGRAASNPGPQHVRDASGAGRGGGGGPNMRFGSLRNAAMARAKAVAAAAKPYENEPTVRTPEAAAAAERADDVRSIMERLQTAALNVGGVLDVDTALELLLSTRMACAAAMIPFTELLA